MEVADYAQRGHFQHRHVLIGRVEWFVFGLHRQRVVRESSGPGGSL